jgi:hypothetical protein
VKEDTPTTSYENVGTRISFTHTQENKRTREQDQKKRERIHNFLVGTQGKKRGSNLTHSHSVTRAREPSSDEDRRTRDKEKTPHYYLIGTYKRSSKEEEIAHSHATATS